MADRRYGLIGHPLGHSWSAEIHELLSCPGYGLFDLEEEELVPFLAREDLGGCNVTIPYKVKVRPLCGEVSDAVAEIGSVNTIMRRADGTLYGDNTDRAGFIYAARRAGLDFSDAKVVVLGSGGTSRTACSAARILGARDVVVISRHGEDNYSNLERNADADIVVNTTPVGMFPHVDAAPVDLASFPSCRGVFDVIYNPRKTRLLAQAERLGVPHTGGLPMLVAQAKASEEVWFSKEFPPGTVKRIVETLAARHAED
jgi:shikimate dehydrogenase